ncbi:Uncharacterized protein APZ42_005465 [Daphnia magna]|uniref:Uncharacterized protein n=1 Tax=Daphnia magna TaxID=35525 RepID=A0A164GFJ5_9CRUS|nr:Uncharacterized protein APZ42_005465 [Daphnia magna]
MFLIGHGDGGERNASIGFFFLFPLGLSIQVFVSPTFFLFYLFSSDGFITVRPSRQ